MAQTKKKAKIRSVSKRNKYKPCETGIKRYGIKHSPHIDPFSSIDISELTDINDAVNDIVSEEEYNFSDEDCIEIIKLLNKIFYRYLRLNNISGSDTPRNVLSKMLDIIIPMFPEECCIELFKDINQDNKWMLLQQFIYDDIPTDGESFGIKHIWEINNKDKWLGKTLEMLISLLHSECRIYFWDEQKMADYLDEFLKDYLFDPANFNDLQEHRDSKKEFKEFSTVAEKYKDKLKKAKYTIEELEERIRHIDFKKTSHVIAKEWIEKALPVLRSNYSVNQFVSYQEDYYEAPGNICEYMSFLWRDEGWIAGWIDENYKYVCQEQGDEYPCYTIVINKPSDISKDKKPDFPYLLKNFFSRSFKTIEEISRNVKSEHQKNAKTILRSHKLFKRQLYRIRGKLRNKRERGKVCSGTQTTCNFGDSSTNSKNTKNIRAGARTKKRNLPQKTTVLPATV